MRHLVASICLLFATALMSQDTTWVNTLTYQSKTRDTLVHFPQGDHNKYEKILMYYSMRCKGGLVSTGTDRNKGCGEWDYSCNTNIIDSSRVDSIKATHPNYIISGYSENYLFYTVTPTYTYTDYVLQQVAVSNTGGITRTAAGQHTGNAVFLDKNRTAGRFWIYYPKEDLAALGTGTVSGLSFRHSGTGKLSYLNIRIAPFDGTPGDYREMDGLPYKEVANRHVTFGSGGQTDVYFHSPYVRSSNTGLIIECSYNGKESEISSLQVTGSDAATLTSFGTLAEDNHLISGSSGAGNLQSAGLSQINKEVTVAFWSRGDEDVLPNNNSVFYATDAADRRQLNVHLPWSNSRVYWDCGGDAGGYDRIDKAALASDFEGVWNHWAFTKNTTTGSMKIYLNGSLWHSGTGKSRAIDISKFSVGAVTDGSSAYAGLIDDFTVYSRELSAEEINKLMHLDPARTSGLSVGLVACFDMNGSNLNTFADGSAFQGSLTFAGDVRLAPFRAKKYFKEFASLASRPDITLLKGEATLTKTAVTYRDSVQNAPLRIVPYSIQSNQVVAGTPLYYWQAVPQQIFDEEGNLTGEIDVEYDDVIDITSLTYYRFSPARYEIMSFVTPYGIGLDLGPEGKTWLFDVTDYGPILKGSKRLLMDKGGEYQEEMDIRFAFVKGKPARDVLDIQQIWPATAYGYTSILNNSQLESRTLTAESDVKGMKIRTMATGHGQEGEFIARTHSININGGSPEFVWQLWKECADNAVFPQGGTWVYDRAGWCPGAPTDLREFEITPLVQPGSSFDVDYGLNTATGDSRYIVNAQLVKYGSLNFTNDIALEEIITPSARVEYSRLNPICEDPVIAIRNNGKNTVSSVTFSYGVDGGSPAAYTWTGTLASLQKVNISLPLSDPSLLYNGSRFFVTVTAVNNATDDYAQNNHLSSAITPVKLLDKDIVITMKTNGAPIETKWTLSDSGGNVIRSSKPNLAPFTIYNDTIMGLSGCYQLRFTDSDQDGISWWANGDGDGYMRVKPLTGGWVFFQPDFGSSLTFNFVAFLPNGTQETATSPSVRLSPNPTPGWVEVTMEGIAGPMRVTATGMDGRVISSETLMLPPDREAKTYIDLIGQPAGMYIISLISGRDVRSYKVVKW